MDLCLETEQLGPLHAAAMVVSTVVPSAEDRFEAKDEGRVLQVEQCRTFDALNRARNVLFGQSDEPPPWLEVPWETMGMDMRTLARAAKAASALGKERMTKPLKEFVGRLDHFEERPSMVGPDRVVTTDQGLQDLLFAAY